MSFANNVSFNNFCHLCMKIKNAAKEKKLSIFSHYIQSWKKKEEELKLKAPEVEGGFYPVLRLLLPHLDKNRGSYGVKETTLAKIYIRILSLPKDGKDATNLLNFRAPKTINSDIYDFAEMAYWILQNRCADGNKLSIDEINKYLDEIAACHAINDTGGIESKLVYLLTATSAEEQKWLIRILLKSMKLGLSQNAILNCYHPDAQDLYEATNNLRKVCDKLKNPEIRLNEIEIELFSPIKPMLSEECDIQKIEDYFSKSLTYYVETKLDGERFQLHMKEGNYKYFSRNGFDYTLNFGANCHTGVLTSRIARQFHLNVRSCILDGEMMIWNMKTRTFSTKGSNIDVKNLRESDDYQPCFCVFDILLYNDKILTNEPLKTRLEFLQNAINAKEGDIIVVNQKKVCSSQEVIDSLNEAIDNREEGIVLKNYNSVYKPNVRKNGGWFKIKPEYVGGLSDTLDLLIIGGYYGVGSHKGTISHFLLGVANCNSKDKIFYSTGKVGSGYSRNELTVLLSKLQSFWNVTEPGKIPSSIEWTKEKPDVWIEPRNSFIIEVKAAEIISSSLFKSGNSLRFPRVEKIRYDKSWDSCMTLEELVQKKEIASGKLATSHLCPLQNRSFIPKKKRIKSAISIRNKAEGTYDVSPVSNLLFNKEICVFSGFGNIDIIEIEKKIIEHGGTIVKNPGKNTFCILAEDNSTVRVKNAIECESHDIILTSWFFSQLQSQNSELGDFKPEYFLAMSRQRKEIFSKHYDEFGDHYTTPCTKEMIKYPMSQALKKVNDTNFTFDDFYDLELELFNGSHSPYGIFRNCYAYFEGFSDLSSFSNEMFCEFDLYKFDYQFRGGKCLNAITNQTTHVIVCSK